MNNMYLARTRGKISKINPLLKIIYDTHNYPFILV